MECLLHFIHYKIWQKLQIYVRFQYLFRRNVCYILYTTKFGRNFKFMLDISISSDGMFVTFYTLQNLAETSNLLDFSISSDGMFVTLQNLAGTSNLC